MSAAHDQSVADLNDASRRLMQENAGLHAQLEERDATIRDLQRLLDATRSERDQWKALARMPLNTKS